MNRTRTFLILVTAALGTLSCAHLPKSGVLRDLSEYPQDPFVYAQASPDSLLMTPEVQNEFTRKSGEKFYSVWQKDTLFRNTFLSGLREAQKKLYQNPGIGENRLMRDSLFAKEIETETALSDGFNTFKCGISVQPVSVRTFPSYKPYFLSFDLPGEGYPFDYWQRSTIPAGTPVLIFHLSRNWLYVYSTICGGWVPRESIAETDSLVQAEMIARDQVVITEDNTALASVSGAYITRADIGAPFPLADSTDSTFSILCPVKIGSAAKLDTAVVRRSEAQVIPMPLTRRNIAALSAKMMNQPYGWGGSCFDRDCSQTLMDLFTGFGIRLARNSAYQASHGGRFVPLKAESPEEMLHQIAEKAVPFTTLIRTPGHIMLYLGTVQGEPVVFHSTWGIKTEHRSEEGRYIIGKTVITSLRAGRELRDYSEPLSWLSRVEGITFLGEQ